jgi:DNA-directed RNA polymerase omega subunit
MARITSQLAAQMIGSQFDLVLVAAQRARELRSGSPAKVQTKYGDCITALKEIEQGLYTKQDYTNSLKNTKRTSRK